jgi:hypothetical protein
MPGPGRGWHERRRDTDTERSDQQRDEPVVECCLEERHTAQRECDQDQAAGNHASGAQWRRKAVAGARAQDEASRQRKVRQAGFERRVAARQLEVLGEVKDKSGQRQRANGDRGGASSQAWFGKPAQVQHRLLGAQLAQHEHHTGQCGERYPHGRT